MSNEVTDVGSSKSRDCQARLEALGLARVVEDHRVICCLDYLRASYCTMLSNSLKVGLSPLQ